MVSKQEELSFRISQMKLLRISKLNERLQETLHMDRILAQNACLRLVNYSTEVVDYLVPALWKMNPQENKYDKFKRERRRPVGSRWFC